MNSWTKGSFSWTVEPVILHRFNPDNYIQLCVLKRPFICYVALVLKIPLKTRFQSLTPKQREYCFRCFGCTNMAAGGVDRYIVPACPVSIEISGCTVQLRNLSILLHSIIPTCENVNLIEIACKENVHLNRISQPFCSLFCQVEAKRKFQSLIKLIKL